MTSREAHQHHPSYLRVEQDDALQCIACGHNVNTPDIYLIFPRETEHYVMCSACCRNWRANSNDCGTLTYEQEHQTPESPATEAIETRGVESRAVRGERELSSPPESSGTEASQAARQWSIAREAGTRWELNAEGYYVRSQPRTLAQITEEATRAVERYNELLASDIPL